jgi:hypothetical protein
MADPLIRDFIGITTYTKDAPTERVIDSTDPDNEYICVAAPGTLESEAGWLICLSNTQGAVMRMKYADGEGKFNKKYTLRATYTYDV